MKNQRVVFFTIILSTIGGCQPNGQEPHLSGTAAQEEERHLSTIATAEIQNDVLNVLISTQFECRTITKTVAGHEKKIGEWKFCSERKPEIGAPVSIHIGNVERTSTTNKSGEAFFNIKEFLDTTDANTAEIRVNGDIKKILPLQGTAFFDLWSSKQNQKLKQIELQIKQKVAQDEQKELQTKQKEAQDKLTLIERALATLTPPWDSSKIDTFATMIQFIKTIDEGYLTGPEKLRLRAVSVKMEALVPSAKVALKQENEQAAAKAIKIGKSYIINKMKAPLSTIFSVELVMLSCPNGFITRHEFMSQNDYGVMLRGEWAVMQNHVTNRIDHSDCINSKIPTFCTAGPSTRCKSMGLE